MKMQRTLQTGGSRLKEKQPDNQTQPLRYSQPELQLWCYTPEGTMHSQDNLCELTS